MLLKVSGFRVKPGMTVLGQPPRLLTIVIPGKPSLWSGAGLITHREPQMTVVSRSGVSQLPRMLFDFITTDKRKQFTLSFFQILVPL